MPSITPSLAQLKQALAISEQIAKLEAELASILGSETSAPAAVKIKAAKAPKRGGKRTMSPEARERIAAAQRARWAKSKGAAAPVPAAAAKATPKTAKPAKKVKGSRTFSPEARAKMAEAARKRWANAKKK